MFLWHCVCVCVYTAPSVSDKQPLCQIGSRFSGAKRTRGSFLKQTPSTMMRRNSSLTSNTVSTTATPTPVGVSTGRGFVFQKGVAKPPSSSGNNQVSNLRSWIMYIRVPPPLPRRCYASLSEMVKINVVCMLLVIDNACKSTATPYNKEGPSE